MQRLIMKIGGISIGVSLMATAACGGHLAEGRTEAQATPADPPASGSVSASVTINVVPTVSPVGNPKYDAFFSNAVALGQAVADARAAMDAAPAALNKAVNLVETTDFETAVTNIRGKLQGKMTVTANVTPARTEVTVVVVPGVTLTPDEQTMLDAYKHAATDIAAAGAKLVPVGVKTAELVAQGAMLVASARSDFTGIKVFTTLPSVVAGISKVTTALTTIKTEAPALIDRSKAMTVAIAAAM